MTTTTAIVETLTAEVRVLMVGSRQVTKSIYSQLDWISPYKIDPFGRVNAGTTGTDPYGYRESYDLEVVGRNPVDGTLVRAHMNRECRLPRPDETLSWDEQRAVHSAQTARHQARFSELRQLHLIVLAGLR